jgi:hypothetical protein
VIDRITKSGNEWEITQHSVYLLHWNNGKTYVGCTKNIKNRLTGHKQSARNTDSALYAHWREMGEPMAGGKTLLVSDEYLTPDIWGDSIVPDTPSERLRNFACAK